MASVKVDVQPFWGADEVDSVVSGLRRNLLIQDLEPGETIIDDALTELDERGYLPFSRLDPQAGSKYYHLILTERHLKVLDGSPRKVAVELVYTSALGDSQSLSDPPVEGLFVGEYSGSLEQTIAFEDYNGAQLIVEYTYPEPEEGQVLPNGITPGDIIEQGGEISVTVPQKTLVLNGLLSVPEGENPADLCDSLLNKTNAAEEPPWQGGDEGTWKCTAANYRVIRAAFRPWLVRYHIEFTYKAAGWDQRYWFKDAQGHAPPDLIEGKGKKTAELYEEVAFGEILPEII